jgi:hypothetical protein
MARYFTPTPSQYVSQFVPPNLELMYKVGQEQAANDSAVLDSLDKGESELTVKGGMYTDKNHAAQINKNIKDNLTQIRDAFYSGKVDSFQAARAMNRLKNEVANDKAYNLYKLDEAYTKSASNQIASGKWNNGLGVQRNGVNVFDARNGEMKINYKIDPNADSDESIAELYNIQGAGEFEKEHQHFTQQASVPKMIEAWEKSGYGVEFTEVNGQKIPVFVNKTSGAKTKGVMKDLVRMYAKQYADKEWDNSTDKPSLEYMRRAGESKQSYEDRLTNLIMPGITDMDVTSKTSASPFNLGNGEDINLDNLFKTEIVDGNIEAKESEELLKSEDLPEIAKGLFKINSDGKITTKTALELAEEEWATDPKGYLQKAEKMFGKENVTISNSAESPSGFIIKPEVKAKLAFQSEKYKKIQKDLRKITDNLGISGYDEKGNYSYDASAANYANYLNDQKTVAYEMLSTEDESVDKRDINNVLKDLSRVNIEKLEGNKYKKDDENTFSKEIDSNDQENYSIKWDTEGNAILYDKTTQDSYRLKPKEKETRYQDPAIIKFSKSMKSFKLGKTDPINLSREDNLALQSVIPGGKVVDKIQEADGTEVYLIYKKEQDEPAGKFTVIKVNADGNVENSSTDLFFKERFSKFTAYRNQDITKKKIKDNAK